MKGKIAGRISQGLSLRGMKQGELAEMAKIDQGSLSSYISGKYEPKQKNICKIAKALDVSESWLMGYDIPYQRGIHEVITSDKDIMSIINAKNKMSDSEWLILMNIIKGGFGKYFDCDD